MDPNPGKFALRGRITFPHEGTIGEFTQPVTGETLVLNVGRLSGGTRASVNFAEKHGKLY